MLISKSEDFFSRLIDNLSEYLFEMFLFDVDSHEVCMSNSTVNNNLPMYTK